MKNKIEALEEIKRLESDWSILREQLMKSHRRLEQEDI